MVLIALMFSVRHVIDALAMLEAIKQSRNESEADMSNGPGQGEQQHTDWWGDPISEERQAELDVLAERQHTWAEQPEAMRGDSPIKAARFNGAEMFWLAKRALAGSNGDASALSAAEERLQDPINRSSIDLSALHLETLRHMGSFGWNRSK